MQYILSWSSLVLPGACGPPRMFLLGGPFLWQLGRATGLLGCLSTIRSPPWPITCVGGPLLQDTFRIADSLVSLCGGAVQWWLRIPPGRVLCGVIFWRHLIYSSLPLFLPLFWLALSFFWLSHTAYECCGLRCPGYQVCLGCDF